eukprot:997452-Lingulodinium_polyedra.AAC.1
MGRSWLQPRSEGRRGRTSTRSPTAHWAHARAEPSTSLCTSGARECSIWSKSTGPVMVQGRLMPISDWLLLPWHGYAAWATSPR